MKPAFLVIDKPAGITSHDVVAAVRAVTGVKKVGHTGTLDPFATGVLALAFGPATKLMQFLDESVKVYDCTIRLGTATDTGDPTGEVIREMPVPELDEEGVEAILATFLGDRMQKPPPFSAVKHQGKPLYWYARRGEFVDVPARPIHVRSITLKRLTADTLHVWISCTRGTYARVLADEIATALGTAGHLELLGRRQSGPFLIEDALSFDDLAAMVAESPGQDWQSVLLARHGDRVPWKPRDVVREMLMARAVRPLDALSHLPMLDVSPEEARLVYQGGVVGRVPGGVSVGDRFLVVSGADLVAVAEVGPAGPQAVRVLPPA